MYIKLAYKVVLVTLTGNMIVVAILWLSQEKTFAALMALLTALLFVLTTHWK